MNENPRPTSGRFVWHETMTTDVEKSVGFYTRLFGWKTKEADIGSAGKYMMIVAGEKTIGGFVTLGKSGRSSHWIGYLTIDDVDAGVERVERLGGKVCAPPKDIPGTGRYAIIHDPTGAEISPFQYSGEPDPEPSGPSAPGEFCWDELLTTDPKAAATFYRELFGWSAEEMDMGEMGKYLVMKRGEVQAAGVMKKPADAPGPSSWLPYVAVEDVDASVAKAKELGAKVHVPPSDIPQVGRFAVLQDPVGADFALFKGRSA